jgi:outer membrane usher protein
VVAHYQGSRGQLGATRIQAIDAGSWELTASGSIARVGGSFFLGRPVRDGFAVVRVPGMRGVPVLVRHQSLGVTDGRGALFVPSLTSHDANSIALDDRSLPADWNLVQRERWVSPPFRGGGIVEFEARRFQSVEGRILLVRNGLATPAEYAGFEVETGSATMRSIVGRNGFFYFENLPAGEHRARIHLGREEGRFVLRVPRTDATTVDLGEIRCEADAIGVLHP